MEGKMKDLVVSDKESSTSTTHLAVLTARKLEDLEVWSWKPGRRFEREEWESEPRTMRVVGMDFGTRETQSSNPFEPFI